MITAAILLERSDWLIGSCTAGHAGMFIWFFSLDCFKALLHTFAIETNLENVVK